MHLTKEEREMLEGRRGEGVQKAMEILTALGDIYNANKFIPIKSAQVSGVSYKNLGDAGLEFLCEWADKGIKVKTPATLNPSGIDLSNWKDIGFPKKFVDKQLKIIDAFRRMGIRTECTCTPYLILMGNKPNFGDHIAWSESSAVSYANSIIGARTNRESGISALSSAITGLTPEYGYHLDENRKADFVINVKTRLNKISDFGALGYVVGKKIGNNVPFFRGIKNASSDQLKSLCASMAASGAVALYHIEGITPEAKRSIIKRGAQEIVIRDEDIKEGYKALNSTVKEIDLVAIGCPHASLEEIESIANILDGKKVKSALWITTSRGVKEMAEKTSLLKRIEESGGVIVSDTCMVVAPIEELGFKSMATNSGKAAFYVPSHCGLSVRFGSLERCICAAVNGVWEDD